MMADKKNDDEMVDMESEADVEKDVVVEDETGVEETTEYACQD